MSGDAPTAGDLAPPSRRAVFFWTAVAVAVVAGSFLAALDHTGATLDDAYGLWGLAGFAEIRLTFLVAASALVLLGLLRPIARLAGFVVLAIPIPVRGIGPFIAGAGAVPLFWILRTSVLCGDWRLVLERLQLDLYYPSNLWTNYAFRAVGLATRPLGLHADDAMALTSAIAGGVFIAFLLRLAGELGETSSRVRFLFWFTLLTGASLVFFGHLEVYAPVAAAVVAFLDCVVKARRGRVPAGATGIVLGVATCLHGTAALFLPPLLLSVATWKSPGRLRRVVLTATGFGMVVLLAAAILFLVHWQASPPESKADRYGTFLGAAGQGLLTPVKRATGDPSPYALTDALHWRDRANLFLRLAPVALLLALTVLLRRGRRRFPDDPVRADVHELLRAMVAVYLAWAVLQNVSHGLTNDWDLFAVGGFVLAVFGGFAVPALDRRFAGLLLGLAAFTAIPWWVTDVWPAEESAVRYHRGLAATYQRAGGPGADKAFERHLSRAAAIGSRPDKEAVRDLSLYLATRRRPEARYWLERAADAYPQDAEMQANLGLFYFGRKMYGQALPRLEAAVALDPSHAIYRRDLGRLLFAMQRYLAGYAHFREAAELKPADKSLVYEVIDAGWKVNRRKVALTLLERLWHHHPEDTEILETLFETNQKIGNLKDARKWQQRLMELQRRQKARTDGGR